MKKALFLFLLLPGCGTASKARKQVLNEMNAIIQAQDCETSCAAIKAYLKERLEK